MIPLQNVHCHLPELDVDHVYLGAAPPAAGSTGDPPPQLQGGDVLCLGVHMAEMLLDLLLGLPQQVPSLQVGRGHLVQAGQEQGVLGHPLNWYLKKTRQLV